MVTEKRTHFIVKVILFLYLDKSTKKSLSYNYLFFVFEINKIYFVINKIEIYIWFIKY